MTGAEAQAAVRESMRLGAKVRATMGASNAQRCRARLERWALHTAPQGARQAWEEGLGDVRHPVGWTLAHRVGYGWRSEVTRTARRYTAGDAELAQWAGALAERGAGTLTREVERALGADAVAAQEAVGALSAAALERPEAALAATRGFKIPVEGLARLARASRRFGSAVLERWWLVERIIAGEEAREEETLEGWAGRVARAGARASGLRTADTPGAGQTERAGRRGLEWPFGARPPLAAVWAEAGGENAPEGEADVGWGAGLMHEERARGRSEATHAARVRRTARVLRALVERRLERGARAAARDWDREAEPEATLARVARAWREEWVGTGGKDGEARLGEEAGRVVWTIERSDVRAVIAETGALGRLAARSCANVPVAFDAGTLAPLERALGVEKLSKARERRMAEALLETRR